MAWLRRTSGRIRSRGPRGAAAYRVTVEAAMAGAVPHRGNAFEIALAKRTLVRALTEVAA